MSSTTDQIERMAKEIMILKINEDLRECKTLEDYEKVGQKYAQLAQEISTR